MNLTIGCKLAVELPTGLSGEFWRTGQLTFEYNPEAPDGLDVQKVIKTELLCFKDQASYSEGCQSMNKMALRVNYTMNELISGENLNEMLWNKLLALPELAEAERLTITI